MAQNHIQINTRTQVPGRGIRMCGFWFNAKRASEDQQWRVVMHADYVATQDVFTDTPFQLAAEMYDAWVAEASMQEPVA